MTRLLARLSAAFIPLLLLSHPAVAQDMQRRSGDGGPQGGEPPLAVLKKIPMDPAHPFVGVWQGTFQPGDGGAESMPETFTIEFLNGAYTGYTSFGTPPRGAAPHRNNTQSANSLTWEMPNSGGGMLVIKVELVDANTMKGVMSSRDVPAPPGYPTPSGTYTLKRYTAK